MFIKTTVKKMKYRGYSIVDKLLVIKVVIVFIFFSPVTPKLYNL